MNKESVVEALAKDGILVVVIYLLLERVISKLDLIIQMLGAL